MSNIVKQSLSTTWVIYGILGCFLVLLSNIFIINEEMFVFISILYAILGIILLIVSKYNRPVKRVSFEDEFREDLENLTQPMEQPMEDPVNTSNNKTDAMLSEIKNKADDTIRKHNEINDPELSQDQSIHTPEAFTTISDNGLYY